MSTADRQNTAGSRLLLRITAKLLLAVAFLACVWVLLSGLRSPGGVTPTVPTEVLPIPSLMEDTAHTHLWHGRPVIVVRRSPDVQRWLVDDPMRASLRDPDSAKASQPAWVSGSERARDPEWFVAIASGTDLGCPVRWLPPSNPPPGWPLDSGAARWPGGFIDSCGQSLYDPAGRVYRQQAAERNLVIPAYRIDTDRLILGAD